jgi:hypothetical protein
METQSLLRVKYLTALRKPAGIAMIIITLPMVTTFSRAEQMGVVKSS